MYSYVIDYVAIIDLSGLESSTNYDLFVYAKGANGESSVITYSFKTHQPSFAAVLKFKLKSEPQST